MEDRVLCQIEASPGAHLICLPSAHSTTYNGPDSSIWLIDLRRGPSSSLVNALPIWFVSKRAKNHSTRLVSGVLL